MKGLSIENVNKRIIKIGIIVLKISFNEDVEIKIKLTLINVRIIIINDISSTKIIWFEIYKWLFMDLNLVKINIIDIDIINKFNFDVNKIIEILGIRSFIKS